MAECSQCLPGEMEEVGIWWRDGAALLPLEGVSHTNLSHFICRSLFPLLRSSLRIEKRCKLFFSGNFKVGGQHAWFMWDYAFSTHKCRAFLRFPFPASCPHHQPFNSRCVVSMLWQDCQTLYLSWHIKICISLSNVVHRDWERDIYLLWNLPWKLWDHSLNVGVQ